MPKAHTHTIEMGINTFQIACGSPKNLCDKDFAELSGELSGAICLKALVLLRCPLELSPSWLTQSKRPFKKTTPKNTKVFKLLGC